MSIQQSLNQALGIGAVLATQTGAYARQKELSAKRAETGEVKSELKKEQKLEPGVRSELLTGKESPEYTELIRRKDERIRALTERLYQLNPSEANAQNYVRSLPFDKQLELAEERSKQANSRAAARVIFKKKQQEMIKNGNK